RAREDRAARGRGPARPRAHLEGGSGVRKIELRPIASIARECKPSPRRKRTPTGSCNRIEASPAPESCPVDITGRYQSNAEPGDPDGRPMNVQINQAGDHLEFQVFLFPAK